MSEMQFAVYPSLRDRVVVVTGGAEGIGESLVEQFVRQRSKVVFLDVQREAAERLVGRLGEAGFAAPVFLPCDLTDMAALGAAVKAIEERFGAVDVLVNNAGNDTRHTIEEVTPEYWDRCMAVNLKQQFFMAQGVIPLMKRAGRGSGGAIINMSSIAWMIPSTGLPVYVTAKAAVMGMTRTLAHELGAENIRVNCVLPGAILTERQRRLWLTEAYRAEVLGAQALKRLLSPDEVARLVLFLAADDSSGITNQSYIIDAGWI